MLKSLGEKHLEKKCAVFGLGGEQKEVVVAAEAVVMWSGRVVELSICPQPWWGPEKWWG